MEFSKPEREEILKQIDKKISALLKEHGLAEDEWSTALKSAHLEAIKYHLKQIALIFA